MMFVKIMPNLLEVSITPVSKLRIDRMLGYEERSLSVCVLQKLLRYCLDPGGPGYATPRAKERGAVENHNLRFVRVDASSQPSGPGHQQVPVITLAISQPTQFGPFGITP